jgi:hypothetical protein
MQVLDGLVVSLEQGIEEALQINKKTKGRRSLGFDFAAVADLTLYLCSILNDHSEPQPIMELSQEFLLKLSCKRAVTRGIQEFGIVFNCRSPSSTLEDALASAHSAALRLYDKKTEGNFFASDFRDSLRTDIMQHGCGIRVREGALVASTTRSKFVSMWTSIGASDDSGDEPASKMKHTIQRLHGLAKLFLEIYPQCELEQNEEMLKAYVAHGKAADANVCFTRGSQSPQAQSAFWSNLRRWSTSRQHCRTPTPTQQPNPEIKSEGLLLIRLHKPR